MLSNKPGVTTTSTGRGRNSTLSIKTGAYGILKCQPVITVAFAALLSFVSGCNSDGKHTSVKKDLADTDEVTIILSTKLIDGYGPFGFQVSPLYGKHTSGFWANTYEPVVLDATHRSTGCTGMIETDMYYLLVNSLRRGRIEKREALQTIEEWSVDTAAICTVSCNSQISYWMDKNHNNDYTFIIDLGNDNDLSNDTLITYKARITDSLVTVYAPRKRMDSLFLHNTVIEPQFEYTYRGSIGKMSQKVMIDRFMNAMTRRADGDPNPCALGLGIGLYEYRKATIEAGGNTWELFVSAGRPGIYSPRYTELMFRAANDSAMAELSKYKAGETFTLGNERFTFREITPDGSSIRLGRIRPAVSCKVSGNLLSNGEKIPDFTATTVLGKKIQSNQLMGSYFLVHFWGTWCGPCIVEMPYLMELERMLGPSGSGKLRILGIAKDNPGAVEKFVKKNGIGWDQVTVPNFGEELFNRFGITTYPSVTLAGPDGTLLLQSRHAGSWRCNELIEKVIEQMGETDAFLSKVMAGNAEVRIPNEQWTEGTSVVGDFSNWVPVPVYREGDFHVRRFNLEPGEYRFVAAAGFLSETAKMDLLTNKAYSVLKVPR
jgi:thiol-disulfide isomerase/thioredoxin